MAISAPGPIGDEHRLDDFHCASPALTKWLPRQGIGRGLLKDAIQRPLQTAEQMGIRVLLCHAIDEQAKAFHLQQGFIESPIDTMNVMLSLVRLQEALQNQAAE